MTMAVVALRGSTNEFCCTVHVSIVHNLLFYAVIGSSNIDEVENEGGMGFGGSNGIHGLARDEFRMLEGRGMRYEVRIALEQI
jgi:hypothetical protein